MKVVVLMSTWQGERFVEEQLRSILDQLPAHGRIIVRDDGSTDGGVATMHAIGDPRLAVVAGSNIGFAHSFLTLLDLAPDDADVVMFSDQDDFWLPGKIARAVERLAPFGAEPALYCSRLQLVDTELRPLGLSSAWKRPPSFRNALTENIAVGCTCAMNRPGLLLARRYGRPELVHFHDWWLYLTISAFGHTVYDPEPTILYRQHGTNSLGAGSGLRRYLVMLRYLRKKNWIHSMFSQIENFRREHGARLKPEQLRLLDAYFDARSPRAVARLLLAPVRFRQKLLDDVLLRVLVLANLVSGRGLLPAVVSPQSAHT
jgi:glycosyltransferase involved in cell wall biosynthesis